jgi:hypothetical protein
MSVVQQNPARSVLVASNTSCNPMIPFELHAKSSVAWGLVWLFNGVTRGCVEHMVISFHIRPITIMMVWFRFWEQRAGIGQKFIGGPVLYGNACIQKSGRQKHDNTDSCGKRHHDRGTAHASEGTEASAVTGSLPLRLPHIRATEAGTQVTPISVGRKSKTSSSWLCPASAFALLREMYPELASVGRVSKCDRYLCFSELNRHYEIDLGGFILNHPHMYGGH